MVSCEFVKKKIEENLKGAKVIVNNPRGDDVHFAVEVEFEGFKDKTRVEQHKIVYNALGEKLNACGEPLHALQIKTLVPNNN